MIAFRLWYVAMLAWLPALLHIELLLGPTGVAPFVPGLCVALALLGCALPRLFDAPKTLLAGFLLAVYVMLKVVLGYSLVGPNLPITLAELCLLGLSVLLARRVAGNLLEFQQAAADVMTVHLAGRSAPFQAGWDEMYRETRRARQFERPLALISLSPTSGTRGVSVNRFVQQAQRETIGKYVDALVADLLAKETNDCDVVTYCDNHFVLLLTETDRQRAKQLVQNLRARAEENLGLSLHIGLSTFPDEEVTFAGLLERAESNMRTAVAESNGQRPTLEQARL